MNSGEPDTPQTPASKRLQAPLPPSPHRTTSQLSVVSVSAFQSDEKDGQPRQLLSQTLRRTPSKAPPTTSFIPASPAQPVIAATGSRDALSPSRPDSVLDEQTLGESSGRKSPGSLSTSGSSRKGKERAVEDVDPVIKMEDVVAEGEIAVPGNGGEAVMGLRELVRRSTATDIRNLGGRSASQAPSVKDVFHILDKPPDKVYSARRYYVLTHAGKPVFRSQDDESEDNITNLMGVAQALISIFADNEDRIRCIVKGRHRIAFYLKAPLYLFCLSDWGEPEHVLRLHLEYIHLQILSVVTSSQLSKVFQRRSNFDLSRLLEGSENFLHKLIDQAQYDFSFLTATLQPLRMTPALRDTAAAALMPPVKHRDLLYVLLVAGGHIVTVLRPRKHSIHPSDLHLLLNTLATSATLRANESWVPMCFPKFNAAGFVHAYVSYILEDVGLVFVSADRDAFEGLRAWKVSVLEKLEKEKISQKIQQSIATHPYCISALNCPGLRHFVYKSRQNVQVTSPIWENPYDNQDGPDRKRLVTLYQKLNDAVHARSGQSSPLRLVYIRTDHEACLAWITKPFELYLTVSPQLSKSAVVAAANTVARWVGLEEGNLFLKDAPVF